MMFPPTEPCGQSIILLLLTQKLRFSRVKGLIPGHMAGKRTHLQRGKRTPDR